MLGKKTICDIHSIFKDNKGILGKYDEKLKRPLFIKENGEVSYLKNNGNPNNN